MSIDYELGEKTLKKCEGIEKHLKDKTLPECISYAEDICGDCGFLHICLPEIKRDALEFTLDPDMEKKLDRWNELKESKLEYGKLDKYIKESYAG